MQAVFSDETIFMHMITKQFQLNPGVLWLFCLSCAYCYGVSARAILEFSWYVPCAGALELQYHQVFFSSSQPLLVGGVESDISLSSEGKGKVLLMHTLRHFPEPQSAKSCISLPAGQAKGILPPVKHSLHTSQVRSHLTQHTSIHVCERPCWINIFFKLQKLNTIICSMTSRWQ